MRFSVPWSHGAQSRARSDRRQRSQQRILCSLPVHLMAYSGAYLSGCRTAQRESPHKGSGSTRNFPSTSSLPRTLTQLLAARAEMFLFFPLNLVLLSRRNDNGANLQRPPVLPQVPYGRPSPIPLAGPNQRLRSGPGARCPRASPGAATGHALPTASCQQQVSCTGEGPCLHLLQETPSRLRRAEAGDSRLTFKTPM
ncbi:unnamed protein product [Boreogadus saida]